MNSVNWALLFVSLGLILLILLICVVSVRWLMVEFFHQQEKQALRYQAEIAKIEVDRRDLLNRLMTKQWESYAQVSQVQPQNLAFEGIVSPDEMPDMGVGEVLVDFDNAT